MSSDKGTNAKPGSPADTKLVFLVLFALPTNRWGSIEPTSTNHLFRYAKIETPSAVSSLCGAVSQPLVGSSRPLVASPSTSTGSGTSAQRPAVTPIQPRASAGRGGGSGARSPEIQRALSGQHDYSWYTDNFHLAKANNIIAVDNAERCERQRSCSLVSVSLEQPKNEKEGKKVKAGSPVLNLENKKPVSSVKGEKAENSKGSGGGR